MKNRYWLPPILLFLSTWPYSFLRTLLPRTNKLLPVIVTFLLFILLGLILGRTCTRRAVLISSAGILMFSFALAILDRFQLGSRDFGLMLAYLWQALFYPFLSLPFPTAPFLHYLFPALVPFAWTPFCKSSF